MAGALLALVGALMIALSVGGTLANAGPGGNATPGFYDKAHSADSKGRDVTGESSGDGVVVGGEGGDEIYDGPGDDLLIGGSDDDFIEASDGERDYVSCGPGYDTVDTDSEDYVADDCELVYRR